MLLYRIHYGPHNVVNVGPLTAEISSGVWGTPANFNRFRVLASLLHRRRSIEVNHTLHDLWLYPGLVHNIYIFGFSCPLTEFCLVQNSLCVQVLPCPILAALRYFTALEQWVSAKLMRSGIFVRQGSHPWHGGRPKPWPHCVLWGLSFPTPKGHSPQFLAHVCCG